MDKREPVDIIYLDSQILLKKVSHRQPLKVEVAGEQSKLFEIIKSCLSDRKESIAFKKYLVYEDTLLLPFRGNTLLLFKAIFICTT